MAMFYDVRILSPDGTMKKVITSNELKTTHWNNFRKAEESLSLQTSERRKIPQWIKEKLDLQFPDFSESRYTD